MAFVYATLASALLASARRERERTCHAFRAGRIAASSDHRGQARDCVAVGAPQVIFFPQARQGVVRVLRRDGNDSLISHTSKVLSVEKMYKFIPIHYAYTKSLGFIDAITTITLNYCYECVTV